MTYRAVGPHPSADSSALVEESVWIGRWQRDVCESRHGEDRFPLHSSGACVFGLEEGGVP